MSAGVTVNRIAHITWVLTRHAVSYAIGVRIARWFPALAAKLPAIHAGGPERLRSVFEDLGGTFIKFGQMLALQPDVLPLEYCNALFNLLDRVVPFDIGEVDRIFREEFGKTPGELFDTFDPIPIASASVGQVHVAFLKGRKLAVKVQRPSVEVDFAGDIRLMTAAAALIQRLGLKVLYWIIEPTREFVEWTSEELDYRREARYMEQQRNNTRNNPHQRVPLVLWEYSSRRTLVADFIEGLTLLDYLRAQEVADEVTLARLRAWGFDPHESMCNILDNFLGDAYRYGMFHADLHPANLMILPRNVIGYIDFGITGVLSRYSRQNLVALTLALGRGDLDAMCSAFFRVSAMNRQSDVDGFRSGLKKLAEDWYQPRAGERRLTRNATLVMFDMLKLSRKTGIYPERDVVKYIRSAIAIDGLITRVAPGFDLGRHLETISDHYLKWHARRALFSYATIVGWCDSSTRLLNDGPFRAASFIDQLADGDLPARVEISSEGRESESALRLRAMLLGGIVLTMSLLMSISKRHLYLGVNIFTTEAMLIAATTLMFLRALRRLAG